MSRYVNLKFRFLSFVVASIVAIVFFSAVFAARAPAMGNSADRAWQLSQLVEGVSTAFNPSHGSLSCVQAGHCVSKQIGLPTVRFSLAGSSLPPGLRARRALFPTCGVVRVAGYSVVWDCGPTPHISLKSTKRSAAAISRSQRSFITFYGALRNILLSTGFPAMFHMITLEQTFANGPLQKISLADASESNRFYPCFRESRDVVSADIPVC